MRIDGGTYHLHTEATTEPGDDLISDPLCRRRVDFESRHETDTDDLDGPACHDPREIIA